MSLEATLSLLVDVIREHNVHAARRNELTEMLLAGQQGKLVTQSINIPVPPEAAQAAAAVAAAQTTSAEPLKEKRRKADAAAEKAKTQPLTAGEAATALDGQHAPKDETPAPAATPAAVPSVSYDDLKVVVLEVVKSKGRDTALGLFKQFGVANAQGLKPEQYETAMAAFKAALGESEELA